MLEARGDSPDAKIALSDLCAAYYNPVFAFIRSHAPDEDSARDLTHEFFSHLLARKGISLVDPQHGRFRSFLLGAIKHFLSDARDHSRRLKRGGGQRLESLEAMSQSTDTSTALQVADLKVPTPDQEFDRKWALIVLDRALTDLAHEHEAAGKSDYFETLKPWLTGDSGNLSQADAASVLGVNEGAVKVAIHRLRRRFRELIKREIAQTLHNPDQVNEELSHLLQALS